MQAVFPQIHAVLSAAPLGADPSVFAQAGAVNVHMHASKVEQDVVEEVLSLKCRE
jgi:hypothetical protein